MKTKFANFILQSPRRVAFTIGVYAGLEITGNSVQEAVTSAPVQAEAAWRLHEHLQTPVILTAMDLSVEAELFGCEIRFDPEEIPTVIGRRVTNLEEIESLPKPQVGEGRTGVNLDAAETLVKRAGSVPVLGGMIGPFSLAGRIFGVSEALEATALHPDLMHALLQRVTAFQIAYAAAFRERGAAGVVMAEPLAGLLSPRALGKFSAAYVRQIVDAVQTEDFAVVLHNCGARLVHLPQVLQSGAEIYHFGAPMDMPGALEQVDGQVILGGNLDPTAVFHSSTVEEVIRQTSMLLEQTRDYPNFILSSGCDIPPGTPVENIRAFYETVQQDTQRRPQEEKIFFFEKQDINLDRIQYPGRILDLGGGGEGTIGKLEGERVVAIAPMYPDRFLPEAAQGALKILMDARELKFLEGTFPVVTSFFTLMYIPGEDHEKVFREVLRVLQPEGRFFIWDVSVPLRPEVPQDYYMLKLQLNLPDRKIDTGYGQPWPGEARDLAYYQSLAKQAGFEVIHKMEDRRVLALELIKPKKKQEHG